MYQHHKVQINLFRERVEMLQAERDGLKFMADDYQRDNDRLRREVEDYKKRMSDLEFNTSNEIKRIRLGAEEQMRQNKEECERRLFQVRSYLTAEIDVNSLIVKKLLVENKWKTEKLRKFATMLRVPRLHFEYIGKHGFNEFVDYCEDIVKRERALQEMKEVDQARIDLRGKHAIHKLRKAKLSDQERFEENRKGRIFSSPFKLQAGPQDQRRDDHSEHQRKKVSEMTTAERSEKSMLDDIHMLNFLKKRSVLNLSELIDKHRDRQPQLIAALSPNIKQQLMTDPHFFKSLQILENQDPINKKVKDVKQFITAMKQQTYDKHFLGSTIDHTSTWSKANSLSRSIVVDGGNSSLKRSLLNTQELRKMNLNSFRNSGNVLTATRESKTRSPHSATENSADEIVFQGLETPARMLDHGLFTFNMKNPIDVKHSVHQSEVDAVNQMLANGGQNSEYNDR